MGMLKEDREQVYEIVKDELRRDEGEVVIKRVWRSGRLLMVSYVAEFDRTIAFAFGGEPRPRKVGYAIEMILQIKKERFGRGAIGYV